MHPRLVDRVLEYGTAGFRTRAEYLDHVFYRIGMLAVLRSKFKKATIGVMITASHNPECDNGVKLVDPLGEMLISEWESIATELANVNDDHLLTTIDSIKSKWDINMNNYSNVVIARDTRSSSEGLSLTLVDGIKSLQSPYIDYGILTTPQLHYMVRCLNANGSYGEPSLEGYNKKMARAFIELHSNFKSQNKPHLLVDGANGVGAQQVRKLYKEIEEYISIDVYNDGTKGQLNHLCGADFVKICQKAPEGVPTVPNQRCASFDGDADRIVYYYFNDENKFHLLDGDKIATLIADFISDACHQARVSVDIGVVQTAYANGASTKYLTDVKNVKVACVCTGVKHLHHRAQQFEIGVYFEANGHGTIVYQKSVVEKLKQVVSQGSSEESCKTAANNLLNFINLTNETVGDAISDMLLVETILRMKSYDIATWNSIYDDLPNRQLKIQVSDRKAFETTNAEQQVIRPAMLQPKIDELISKYNKARSFVRPSGTEDVVRVYAEADTQANADQLAYEVGMAVYKLAGGCGKMPTPPSS